MDTVKYTLPFVRSIREMFVPLLPTVQLFIHSFLLFSILCCCSCSFVLGTRCRLSSYSFIHLLPFLYFRNSEKIRRVQSSKDPSPFRLSVRLSILFCFSFLFPSFSCCSSNSCFSSIWWLEKEWWVVREFE